MQVESFEYGPGSFKSISIKSEGRDIFRYESCTEQFKLIFFTFGRLKINHNKSTTKMKEMMEWFISNPLIKFVLDNSLNKKTWYSE